eukprot:TRINITY_DN121769_c0_g1_i1.p2 TRINITY_DN121769_c0_g1~~TRINITY_DN121769_c0_g1_i1.p2  ORF type:complete len:354 (-),score=63.70 TRINITY_DN121769_c0_g1_i1:128-1189(-)
MVDGPRTMRDAMNNMQRLQGVPRKMIDAFTSNNISMDGVVDKAWLTKVFQHIEGSPWTEDRVGRALEAAGADAEGKIQVNEFLSWVCAGSTPGTRQPSNASSPHVEPLPPPPAPPAPAHPATISTAPVNGQDDEPCSPKIGRSKEGRRRKKKQDMWDSPPPVVENAPGDDMDDPMSPKLFSAGSQHHKVTKSTDDFDPTSPMSHLNVAATGPVKEVERRKGRGKTKRLHEQRARLYEPFEGDRLFVPMTHPGGLLLLRPDGTFAYIHDNEAKFSEGVHGSWVQDGDAVVLEPTYYGWCYQQSFEDSEILDTRPRVTLTEEVVESNRRSCILPEEYQMHFSWMDPTIPETSPRA